MNPLMGLKIHFSLMAHKAGQKNATTRFVLQKKSDANKRKLWSPNGVRPSKKQLRLNSNVYSRSSKNNSRLSNSRRLSLISRQLI
ncbi:hypothetical protein HMPREF2760_01915 [Corynebacterium sp. HMSC065D07]|nr:hypothetical protein HMPREF2760_01915 [Corynebacterium sp. HMSC065D07]